MPDVLVSGAYGGAYEDASGPLKLWAHAVARGAAVKIVEASGSRGGGWWNVLQFRPREKSGKLTLEHAPRQLPRL